MRSCGEKPLKLPDGTTLLKRRIAGVPLLMLPRINPPADLDAQLAEIRQHRLPLILSPETSVDVARAIRIAAPRTMLQLPVSPCHTTNRAALHQKWRHQLGQAEKAPLRVVHRRLTPDHSLFEREAKQARERGYRNLPAPLILAFAEASPDQTHLFTALLRGHPVAYMLFLSHGKRATYHIGFTTDDGRKVHAHNLVLWQAMKTLSGKGVNTIDLGPLTTAGIDRFKTRAGAHPIQTGGNWLRWSPLARKGRT
ncbi:hypothetical protein DSW25_11280 [Sulfitobacter donghicola DSW-25 = KCTC 12864 = JCM 14565]|uniref:BioF2-like acetyltransferase domain-containing protein n=1 Tax=Sulfitobacter donghicola DSW-25 = KCTC 12864 = JCM 14565 TaxID=1300350 RepID=A0A073IJ36_9RHOB|nr:hypothetical protein DSW25_11280 [Sulfitobacter donghicola DSW-25 = KCTC 12864 = JCM 14565]